MAEIVADTSAWIAYFSGESFPAIDEALDTDAVILPPLIVAELVSGAGMPRDREDVGNLLQNVTVYPTELDHWISVGLLRQQLRRVGLSIALPDAHIAQCAIERDATLLTRDAVFAKIARYTTLRVAML